MRLPEWTGFWTLSLAAVKEKYDLYPVRVVITKEYLGRFDT